MTKSGEFAGRFTLERDFKPNHLGRHQLAALSYKSTRFKFESGRFTFTSILQLLGAQSHPSQMPNAFLLVRNLVSYAGAIGS